MDRPIALHVRGSPKDLQLGNALGKVLWYDALDAGKFCEMVRRAENGSSLPQDCGRLLVVAEFAEGKLTAFESIARYLEVYKSPEQANPVPTSGSEDESLTEETLEEYRIKHEETCRKVVENYTSHINLQIIATNVAVLYNRVINGAINVTDDLRREIHYYIKLVYYKTSLVPLRGSCPEREIHKLVSMMAVFDEAETDDTRTLLSQVAAPAPMILSLSRVQRRTRDKEYVLHCLAALANLRFETEGGLQGGSSMYL